MRLFGSERMTAIMETMRLDEDTPIDAKILSGAIENAQKTVESRNFQVRKNVLEYDDVMNTQRKVIYEQRQKVLDGEDLGSTIDSMMQQVVHTHVAEAFRDTGYLADRGQLNGILAQFEGVYFAPGAVEVSDRELDGLTVEQLSEKILAKMHETYARKEAEYTAPVMRELERVVLLRVVDENWMDHIDAMTDLRQGVGLRAYGQYNAVDVYKKEGYEMFEGMIAAIGAETVSRLFRVRLKTDEEIKREKVAKITGEGAGGDKSVKRQPVRKKIKVGPNDPCPCGSGKKYKKCCRDKDLAAERTQS